MDEKRHIFVISSIDRTFSLNRAEKRVQGEIAHGLKV